MPLSTSPHAAGAIRMRRHPSEQFTDHTGCTYVGRRWARPSGHLDASADGHGLLDTLLLLHRSRPALFHMLPNAFQFRAHPAYKPIGVCKRHVFVLFSAGFNLDLFSQLWIFSLFYVIEWGCSLLPAACFSICFWIVVFILCFGCLFFTYIPPSMLALKGVLKWALIE